jgi:hypothetical protein
MRTFLIVCLLFFSGELLAQVSFVTEVSSNQVAVGDRIQVQFTLHNANGRDFRQPSFKGFSVLSGPSTSQSSQWINGKTSSSISYVYLIQADVEGKFTIESASINVDGKKLTSNPVTITISKGSVKPKPKNDETELNQQAESIVHKNLFLKLVVNKQQAYQGEPIVATYKLYIHPQLSVLQLGQPKMPSFNGFWTQDLGIKELQFVNESINGVTYKVADLKKVVLLPQQSGNLIVYPMEIESVVRLEVRNNRKQRSPFDDDFFDSFFGNNYKDFKFIIKSRSSDINIKPLPKGAASDYAGAVGNLQIKSSIDKTKLKTGDAATLRVTISGFGNLKLIEALPLTLPPDLDVFDPKVSENINVGESGMNGSKSFEYYIVPRNPGEFRIDPIQFTFFDLNSKSYTTLTTDSYVLNVEKGTGTSFVSGTQKEGINYLSKDISYIKNQLTARVGDSGFTGSFLFYLTIILPFLSLVFLFLFIRKRDEEEGNQSLLKLRRARKLAIKRLSLANKHIQTNKENEFYEEISRVLWGYLSDKLLIPVSSLSRQSAVDMLSKKNVDDKIINELTDIVDYCEFVRFAPGSERKSMKEVYDKSAGIITVLEGSIK